MPCQLLGFAAAGCYFAEFGMSSDEACAAAKHASCCVLTFACVLVLVEFHILNALSNALEEVADWAAASSMLPSEPIQGLF